MSSMTGYHLCFAVAADAVHGGTKADQEDRRVGARYDFT